MGIEMIGPAGYLGVEGMGQQSKGAQWTVEYGPVTWKVEHWRRTLGIGEQRPVMGLECLVIWNVKDRDMNVQDPSGWC